MKHKKHTKRKKPLTKKQIYTEIKNVFLVIAGSVILGLGTGIFLVPFNIIAGGVTGLGITINQWLTPSLPQSFIDMLASVGLDIMDVYVTALTWLMFFIGLIILGKNFALKTLVSSMFYPIAYTLSGMLLGDNVLGGFFNLKGSSNPEVALILAAICGGALVGAGCAITFMGGGSTGGVDIIALSICKFAKRAKSAVVIFAVDASVIILGIFAINDLTISLLGIASAMVGAIIIDYLFGGADNAFKAEIISERADEINQAVRKQLNRTTTFMSVVGGYSGEKKRMVMVTFTMREYSKMLNIINTVDRDAFVTITRAHEINGEGWTFNTKKEEKSRGQLEHENKHNGND